MTPEPTYYEMLGISPDATQQEIKTAFRQAAIRNHPDQGGNATLFRMIEDAYEVLVSPSRRAEYDASLQRQHAGGGGFDPHATHSWSEPPYADSTWRDPDHDYDSQQQAPPSGRPKYVVNQLSSRPVSRGIKRLIFTLCVLWVITALLVGLPIIPGLPATTSINVLLVLLIYWIFGSFILRIAGWALFIFALIDAHWFGASGALTALRIIGAFGLWLAGQWLYTFKHGNWRSIVAHSALTRLPGPLRPDHRWTPPSEQHA